MPIAFPSHQGLILPVWAKWPERFNGLSLCVGAAVPDIVDGAIGMFRGHLGQGIGHSLVGLVALSVPVGLVVTGLLRKYWWRPRTPESWFVLLDNRVTPQSAGPEWRRDSWSVLVGAASHVFTDFITHDTFVLLLPWYHTEEFFPLWWRRAFGAVELYVYPEPYPLAFHTLLWAVLSVVGAVVYVRILKARARAVAASEPEPVPAPSAR
jgi:hypothetical protein